MSDTVSHLHSSTYNGVSYTVDEKRTDSYDEGSSGQTFTMNYTLQAAEAIDLDTARAMATAFVTAKSLYTREGNPVSRFQLEHDNEDDLDRVWSFSIEWATPSSSGGGSSLTPWPHVPYEENESWSSEGGTAHISEAVGSSGSGGNPYGETVYQVDSNDPGPSSFFGRIGWNGETSEGVDVVRPAFSFTLQRKMTAAELDTVGASGYSYRQIIVMLTGSVNNAPFRGWSAGNVLFEGASSTASAEYDDSNPTSDGHGGYVIEPTVIHTITFKFRCMFGRTGMPVAGASVDKEGFQYMWIYSKKQDDSTTGVSLEYPQTIVVNDVYDKNDFSLLGLS